MSSDPERWLHSLPAELALQRRVIERLLEHARADDRLRLFVVGCSIGRGAADTLSDVDALIGVREAAFDDVTRSSAEIVTKSVSVFADAETSPTIWLGLAGGFISAAATRATGRVVTI